MDLLPSLCALALGILTHVLSQIVGARRAGGYISLRCYFVQSWPETMMALTGALGLWLALPELAAMIPDVAGPVELGGQRSILGSFGIGLASNAMADALGGRLSRLIR